MSRKRYISTDISIDKKLNRVSDAAALLYSWMIPHAGDDCRMKADDPEELRLIVMPGRKKTDEEVEALIEELMEVELIGREDDGHYYFPSETFYKYQTVINGKNRRETPRISRKQQESPRNAKDQQKSPEKAISSSSSVSSSVSFIAAAQSAAALARAREEQEPSHEDIGLGERHPGNIVGWELWRKLEAEWRARGKIMGIYRLELIGKQLLELKEKGHDPVKVVEKTIRAGWAQLHPLDSDEIDKPPGEVVTFDQVRARAMSRDN